MNGDADIEEGCGCSSADVYEFALHSRGSRIDRRSCHSGGCPSRQLAEKTHRAPIAVRWAVGEVRPRNVHIDANVPYIWIVFASPQTNVITIYRAARSNSKRIFKSRGRKRMAR
jgi:hypothetical protein